MSFEQVPALTTAIRDGVMLIGLNRPDVINAVNDDIRAGLRAALAVAEEDGAVHAILLHGHGARGFCAGADIKERHGPETVSETRSRLERQDYVAAIEQCRKPVIAAIHGFCMGAGMEIALACDIRVASADAMFGLPETGLGLIPGAGGTQRLPRLVGQGQAMHIILTGEKIPAQRAMAIGLVSEVVGEDEDLLGLAMALAAKVARKAPIATIYAKEAVRAAGDVTLSEGLALERSLFAILTQTEDKVEAAQAFKEKRNPVFLGR